MIRFQNDLETKIALTFSAKPPEIKSCHHQRKNALDTK